MLLCSFQNTAQHHAGRMERLYQQTNHKFPGSRNVFDHAVRLIMMFFCYFQNPVAGGRVNVSILAIHNFGNSRYRYAGKCSNFLDSHKISFVFTPADRVPDGYAGMSIRHLTRAGSYAAGSGPLTYYVTIKKICQEPG